MLERAEEQGYPHRQDMGWQYTPSDQHCLLTQNQPQEIYNLYLKGNLNPFKKSYSGKEILILSRRPKLSVRSKSVELRSFGLRSCKVSSLRKCELPRLLTQVTSVRMECREPPPPPGTALYTQCWDDWRDRTVCYRRRDGHASHYISPATKLTLCMASSHYQKTCLGINFISCGLCRTATDSELLLLLLYCIIYNIN